MNFNREGTIMTTEIYIKFDGVEGESTNADHRGEIAASSWTWSLSVPTTVGGGGASGRPTPGNIQFVHRYDKASPVLANKCAQGARLPSVVLTARRIGEGQKDFLKVTMKDVLIISVQPSWSSGSSGSEIVEAVAMSYGNIEFGYKAQDAKGGLGNEVKFSWDIKSAKVA